MPLPELKAQYAAPVCSTLRDLDELENVRTVWSSWTGSLASDLDFFSCAIQAREGRCRPHIVVLTRNGAPDAVLIGLLEKKKLPFTFSHFTVCEPWVRIIEFVHGGVRGNGCKENCIAIVQAVMRSLKEGEADLALWDRVDVRSHLYNCVCRLPPFPQRDHSLCLDGHWMMSFPRNGLEALFASLRPGQRSKLRRKYKNILSRFAGKVQLRCMCSLEGLELALPEIEAIATKSEKWLGLGWSPQQSREIQAQMAVAADKGWLRVYLLYLEEKPVAFWIGTVHNQCLQADQVGYDPDWKKFSPGIFLLLKIFEDLRGEDIKTVDLGWGDTQLRKSLGSARQLEARVHIYAPTWRGLQLNLLSTVTQAASRGTKRLIRSVRGEEWARRVLRNRLGRRRQEHGLSAEGEKRYAVLATQERNCKRLP